MNLKQSLLIAVCLSITFTVIWEFFWRFQGEFPDIDDNKDLWAVQRARVENLTEKDIVLLGSSRVLFNIQLDVWEKETGIRPIQLASAGTTPLPAFHDIVNNTSFNGTVLVGVTPGLFFSTTNPNAGPWARIQSRIDHYKNRTYVQRFNHWLSMPLQKNFVLISTTEEGLLDDIDLKALLKRGKLGKERTGKRQFPGFYKFENIDDDRNVKMLNKTVTDSTLRNSVKAAWSFFLDGKGAPLQGEATTSFFKADAEKFVQRGGTLVLLRSPSSGRYKTAEAEGIPRSMYWDSLVLKTNAKAYHYEDYEKLKHFDCPEWSHLSAPDAELFTSELVKIMKEDKLLTTSEISRL
jgi:hypothetical protein